MLMTMSISRAPSRIARRASMALTSLVAAPNGKPMTDATATSVPRRLSAARRTQVGLMQTAAKRCSAASAQSLSMSAAEASGLRSVWSMKRARSPGTSAARPWYSTRVAPPATTSRTLGAHCAAHARWQAVQASEAAPALAPVAALVAGRARLLARSRARPERGEHLPGDRLHQLVSLAARLGHPARPSPGARV